MWLYVFLITIFAIAPNLSSAPFRNVLYQCPKPCLCGFWENPSIKVASCIHEETWSYMMARPCLDTILTPNKKAKALQSQRCYDCTDCIEKSSWVSMYWQLLVPFMRLHCEKNSRFFVADRKLLGPFWSRHVGSDQIMVCPNYKIVDTQFSWICYHWYENMVRVCHF